MATSREKRRAACRALQKKIADCARRLENLQAELGSIQARCPHLDFSCDVDSYAGQDPRKFPDNAGNWTVVCDDCGDTFYYDCATHQAHGGK